ncbi:AIPR family protein [soil metagenome]
MSALKVNQIRTKLRAKFESHLDLSDVNPSSQDAEAQIISRCLAAFAIFTESGCSEKLAAQAVWDGGGDNGIDAAYFDSSDNSVILVQSKFIQKGAGEPSAADVGTFLKGVRDVIEQDDTLFDSKLSIKLGDICTHLNNPGTKVSLVTISTGSSSLSAPAQGRIDSMLLELNGSDPDPIVSASNLGLQEVYSRLASDPNLGVVGLEAIILDWAYVSSPYSAYFGIIDGFTLKSWWSKHGKRVVSENIRHALGSTEVNNEIKATAIAEPEKFWYFNNGITLIADEVVKAPANMASKSSGMFQFKGASVVNGAQTISTLARISDDSKLALVRVPIRVVILNGAPANFGGDVTRTNNLQNRVEPRDFVAQDDEQKRLRQEMAIEGIDYQFVRSDEVASTLASCELIELTTALACSANDVALAVQVKTGISRFFADLSKPPYRAIFNPSLSGAVAFNTLKVQREIDAWIEKKKMLVAKKSGPAWGVLIHGNRVLSSAVFTNIAPSYLACAISKFGSVLPGLKIDEACEAVYTKMVKGINEEFANKFLAVLFKNTTMSKRLYDLAKS